MMMTKNISAQKKSEKIRIVIVDDHSLMRQAVRMWIEKEQDMEVIAEARDGDEAFEITKRLHPDIIILDISMPKLNGLETTRRIVSSCPETSVLVLTVHADKEHILGMQQAGAKGYLLKSIPGEEVVHAVRAVLRGETLFPIETIQHREPLKTESKFSSNELAWGQMPMVDAKTLHHASIPIESEPNKLMNLSHRELKILKYIASGMSNKDIAIKLGLSIRSEKAILTTIYLKLGISSRTEAISKGLKTGILTIDDLNQ